MHDLVIAVGFLNVVVFGALGVIAVWQLRRRNRAQERWIAVAFGSLGLIVLLGLVVPDEPSGFLEHAVQRLEIVALVVFPYLLYGFTTAFEPPSLRLRVLVGSLTGAMVVWTLALRDIPGPDDPRPPAFWVYVVGFLVHWTVLSVVAAWRLWRAGERQPSVARRRMQFLALAVAMITIAIVLVAASDDPDSPAAQASTIVGFLCGCCFLLGLAPPQLVRVAWRRPELDRLQAAIRDLITLATTPEEVAARVVGPTADIVGAQAVAVRDGDGRVLATQNVGPETRADLDAGLTPEGRDIVTVEGQGASLVVWSSPYAPYFGADELQLLTTLAALTGIALDRVRLYTHEVETRVQLERLNDLKTNFVALAAHELRTPVTTIHGFVTTLNHLGDRLSKEQQDELRLALEQQTTRMALLVEQLLDLSRLDADAIEIRPQQIDVRERVDEVLASAAGTRAGEVDVDVDAGLEVTADAAAFDRVLSNLVTNALRYGAAPVTVIASQTDRHFRLSVEDHGRGVPPDFVPNLFERFARARSANDHVSGTGLGLAIARSYARAHGGDLVYEPTTGGGARFTLVLPNESARR